MAFLWGGRNIRGMKNGFGIDGNDNIMATFKICIAVGDSKLILKHRSVEKCIVLSPQV